jgi:hypothetical protein
LVDITRGGEQLQAVFKRPWYKELAKKGPGAFFGHLRTRLVGWIVIVVLIMILVAVVSPK